MIPRNAGRAGCVLLLLVAVLAGRGAAQQPGAAEFWYALEASRTVTEVRAVESPAELDPVVTEALRRLREYELEPVRGTAYRGRWELERVVSRRPRDAWSQLALALVLRRGPDAHVRNSDSKASYHFVDPYSNASAGAIRALRRALALDPELELAAVELARYAEERHDEKLVREAEAALAGVAQTGEVLLQRAALALKRGDNDEAVRQADAALRAGADAGRVAHTRAVALLRDPATEAAGAAVYLAGLETPSAAALAEYQRTAAPIFFRAEVALWDSLPEARRGAWLRELWELRAALSGVSVAERLGVHFRRLRQAQVEWPLDKPFADAEMFGGAAILTGEELRRHGLTPQGLMLTRSGDPARLRWLGICGTEKMPYMPDMAARARHQPRMPTAGVLDRMLPPGGRRPVDNLDVLQSEDRRRIQEVDCSNPSSLLAFTRYIVDGDRYRIPFDTVLYVEAEAYAFRGAGGADVVIGITVPVREVAPLADALGSVRLRAALAFVDTTARRTSRADHDMRFMVPGVEASHVLLAMPAHTPLHGELDLRLTVADDARRAGVVLSMAHAIPDFHTDGLLLSDLVIAPAVSVGRMRRGNVDLAVAAGRKYRSGELFDLYYEVYGLAEGATYRTRIVLAPQTSALWRAVQQITGREPDVVALQFEETAGAPHRTYGLQQLRTVGTTNLRAGTYRVRIEVTDTVSGRSAVRERLLDIH